MSEAIDTIPPPIVHSIVRVDPSEIASLLRSLPSTSIVVHGSTTLPTGLRSVNITENTLKHIFGMEIVKEKTRGIKYFSYGGFHHINNSYDISDRVYSFRLHNVGNHVTEGYLVVDPTHLPKYKTYFRGMTREEILEAHAQSLGSVISVEEKDWCWTIIGASSENISITTVVEKSSGNVVTIYPTSSLSPKQREEYDRKHQLPYIHSFFNPCFPPLSGPVVHSANSRDLQEKFGDGYYVGLKFVFMDIRLSDYDKWRLLNNIPVVDQPPRHCLLTDAAIEASLIDIPNRFVRILNVVDKLYLPLDSIEKIFFDGNRRFVQYITPIEALKILKEVLDNYCTLVHDNFQESDWEDMVGDIRLSDDDGISDVSPQSDHEKTGTEWDYFRGPVLPDKNVSVPRTSKYALELMNHQLCCTGTISSGDQSIQMCLPVPHLSYQESIKLATLLLPSNGTCYMDTWKVIIKFDPTTGIIHDFDVH